MLTEVNNMFITSTKKVIKHLLPKKLFYYDYRDNTKQPTPLQAYYEQFKTGRRYLINVPVNLLKSSRLLRVWMNVIQEFDRSCDEQEGKEVGKNLLKKHFDEHQPRTVADVLKISPNKEWHKLESRYFCPPWSALTPQQAAKQRQKTMEVEMRQFANKQYRNDDGWKGYGPVSNAVLDMETDRLFVVYQSVKKRGLLDSFGFIGGQLFVSGQQELVAPKGGWHRVAVCLALKHRHIPMMFRSKTLVLRREDVRCWPNVISGLYSEEEALMYFDRQFKPLL